METLPSNGLLMAPERNHYFYGKLLDVKQLEKEQSYFNKKRRRINRLVLGSGVVCGLGVERDADDATRVRVQPGVALDDLGREIIVPWGVSIDPRQLTDDQGQPTGETAEEDSTIEVCLAYAETRTDLVPVVVPDCDTQENCAPSTIHEGFYIIVRQLASGDPLPPPIGEFPSDDEGQPITSEALHAFLCGRISDPCPESPANPCVPLARVTLPLADESDGANIDPCAGRRLIYGNALLYELILHLFKRVEQLEQQVNDSDGT